MTEKLKHQMPEEIYATHNGNGINPVHFGRWEDAEDCFDEHEPTTKYLRADLVTRPESVTGTAHHWSPELMKQLTAETQELFDFICTENVTLEDAVQPVTDDALREAVEWVEGVFNQWIRTEGQRRSGEYRTTAYSMLKTLITHALKGQSK